MTILINDNEIRSIKEAGSIVRYVLDSVKEMVREGLSTQELDVFAENAIRERGGEPAFKGYRGYPATICSSINDVVVHGIPSPECILNTGDIIAVDVGVKKNGYYADAARTYSVGEVDPEAYRLMDVARRCLDEGIKMAVAGNRLYDISSAIQETASKEGFQEVRAFVGHGIGTRLHEPPEVPNWGRKGKGMVLEEGLVLAIEPMINQGVREVEVLEDGWTAVTCDGKLSAHFEDTIIVGTDKTERIT